MVVQHLFCNVSSVLWCWALWGRGHPFASNSGWQGPRLYAGFPNIIVVWVSVWDHVIRAVSISQRRSGKPASPWRRITHLLIASGLFLYLKTKEVLDFLYYICSIMSKKTGVQTWTVDISGRFETCFIEVNCKYPVGVEWTLQGWVSEMLCFINKPFETSVGFRKYVLILPSRNEEIFS